MCVIMLGLVSILLLTLVNHIYLRWVLVLPWCFAEYLSRLNIGCDDIQWTDRLKYLGITVCSGKKCEIDISVSLRKAYSAANSILSKTKYVSEIVRLNLIESYVCPILFYALEAVTLSLSEQIQFAICLNNLYRRIFGMHKWESVKPVQYFCGKLDFVIEYNLRRLRFFSGIRPMHNDALLDCVNNLWCLTLSIILTLLVCII